MATLFDDASLVMIPSGYKDDKLYSIKPTSGDGDFTFSRDGSGASPATRVNSAGLIEKGRTNFLLQSNQFDTTWTQTDISTLTSGQSGYDGTNDAWLVEKSASSNGYLRQNISSSGVRTFSLYAKSGTLDGVLIQTRGASTKSAQFDLSTGTLGTAANNIDAKIEDIGSGWYRCSVSVNDSAITQVRVFICDDGTTIGTTAGSIYIQDAQLEKGLVATSYIETTTAAASAGILGDMPRLDYSGGATCPSLLLEPARTNVVEYAEYFDIYTKSNATITNNDSSSPEGLQNASSLAGNGATSSHYIYRNFGTAVSGTDYTISFFAKSGSLDYVQLVMGSGAFGVLHQNFDLANGTIGSSSGSVTPFIDNYTDGWYRVGITITATASTTITPFIALANSSTMSRLASFATSDDVKIYGLQIEAGSYPTSYVPTYGSATARAVDSCIKTGISSILNASEGTLFAEINTPDNSSTSKVITIGNSTTNRIQLFYYEDSIRLNFTAGGTSQAYLQKSITVTDTIKVAARYSANDVRLYVNGSLAASDTSATMPSALDYFRFDNGAGGASFIGDVKQAIYFDSELTDAECISLTTI